MLPADAMNQPKSVCSVSGAAFVISRSVFEEIGGFDERFFLYAEDNDLSWRAQLAGYRCLYVPEAVVHHEYTPRFGPDKYFYLERNRYQLLLKNLRWRTLGFLMPALTLAEVVAWGYAFLRGPGHVRAKLSAYRWLVAHWGEILEARREVQGRRKSADRDILSHCGYALAYELASGGSVAKLGKAVFDPLFFVLYRVCLAMVRW
jgi:GT2 family glycosyltransferase